MKLKNPLLAVRDMERSKAFYKEVLGLRVVMDFGANVTLTGGLCLQTLDTWAEFLGKAAEAIRFGGGDSEVYFEEDDFDGFLARLDGYADVVYVHPPLEHRWGCLLYPSASQCHGPAPHGPRPGLHPSGHPDPL